MVEAQEQAKQLDSVTDKVHEKEVDASKALQAMSSLSIGGSGGGGKGPAAPSSSDASTSKAPASPGSGKATSKGGASSSQLALAVPVVVDPKDVQLIVDELEVTREAAEKALRKAIAERSGSDASADPPVVAALRILVTSI